MMSGKEKCKLLKEIRKEFADANGIPYEPKECHYEGDCLGTCPACEKEAEDLLALAKQKKEQGEEVKTIDLEKKCQQLEAERIEEFLESSSDLRGDIDFSRYQKDQDEQVERIKDDIRSVIEDAPEGFIPKGTIRTNCDSVERLDLTTMGITEKLRLRMQMLKDFIYGLTNKQLRGKIVDEEYIKSIDRELNTTNENK